MLANEALEDFTKPLRSYSFEDGERLDNPVRLNIQPAVGALDTVLVQGNLMWCLHELAIMLFEQPSIWGSNFKVQYAGKNLYFGRLDNRNRAPITSIKESNNDSMGDETNNVITAMSLDVKNTTNRVSNNPSLDTGDIDIKFSFHTSSPLPPKAIFTAILDAILESAPFDISQGIEQASFVLPDRQAWIFLIHHSVLGTAHVFRVYQMIAILQAIAQYYIAKQTYQELLFNFIYNEQSLAGGCVTRPELSSAWCSGMGEMSTF